MSLVLSHVVTNNITFEFENQYNELKKISYVLYISDFLLILKIF